jgi:hypothetical protein
MILRRATFSIAAVTLLLSLMSTASSAAAGTTQVSSSNGLRVSPVRTELTIYPGQSKTVPVYVTNATKTPASLQVIIDDFIARGDNGTPALLIKQSNGYNPHSLKQFIAPIKNVLLAPEQESLVNVVINIPKSTPGGGYYAAVRFAPASINATHNVTLAASVASLILVKVPGPGMKEQLDLNSFNVSNSSGPSRLFFGSNGLSAIVKFENTGNVQEEPYGKIEVQSGSKTIMTKVINNVTPPGSVLPGSYRQFSVPLSGLGSFGKYTVNGYFGYGTSGQLLSASTTIYVVAYWIIILAVIVLFLIIFGIWGMPKVFRYWYKRSIRSTKHKEYQ